MKIKLILPLLATLFFFTFLFSDEPIPTTIKDILKTPWKYNYRMVTVQGQVLKEFGTAGYRTFSLIDDEYEIKVYSFNRHALNVGDWITITGEFWGIRDGRHINTIDISDGSLEKIRPIRIAEIVEDTDQYNNRIVIINGKVIASEKKNLDEESYYYVLRILDGNYWINVVLHDEIKYSMNDNVLVAGRYFKEKYFASDTLYNLIEVR